MPKVIKGNAGESRQSLGEPLRHRRLVPAPDAGSAADRRAVDESIRAAVRGLEYAVKWKRGYYGLADLGWIIEIAAYDVSVNVVFLGGADFESPPLGTTDRERYLKVTSLEEAERPELQKWIEQADARRVGRNGHRGRTTLRC